jgi:glycosyltransferase involved in cell wall biosynthesis
MNVLVVTNLFPSAREPLRGLFNLRRFDALARFCQVHVIAPVPAWKRIRHPADLTRIPSGSVEGVSASYPTCWTMPRLMPHWHAAQIHQSIRSHVRDVRKAFPFDVVLGAFAYPDVVVASRVAADASCPYVALVMGSDMNDLAQRLNLRGHIREALSHASRVVAVSDALRQRVLELGIPHERILVQHNGVNGERFRIRDRAETRRTLGLAEHENLITFVGNLVYEKGSDVLIEAMGRLRATGSRDVRVALIGDGTQKQALLSRCDALGIGDRVSFAGRQSPDDVALWLSASDMLCLPSRREGCPNVVLEALASGRPVVAARVGGVPELLNERNGLMVPPDSPAELAEALSETLRRTWNASELRASVPALTWEEVGRTLHDVLSQAVKSHQAR